jgi:YesN/AraC family two-component response regulator
MYRLVIVEDDYLIRTGLGNMFPWNNVGFDVVGCFENGKEALDYIQSHPVDIVLSDIRMPVMSGLDLARELSRLNPTIYIVFLSAFEDFSYAQQAIEYGARKYLIKSTKYDDLISTFQKIKTDFDQRESTRNIAVPLSSDLSVLLPEGSAAETPPEPESRSASSMKVERILLYIQKNYKTVTLQNTADQIKVSPVYMSRFFKEKTNTLFVDYVTAVRMNKAAELIRTSDYKLYQISEMVGYSNPKNFSRAFKHYFKVSPQEYREEQEKPL